MANPQRGAYIEISPTGFANVAEILIEVIAKVENLSPVLGDIGEYLQLSHREHFDNQQGPDGQSWQTLSPNYLKQKPKNAHQILRLNDIMRDTLAYHVDPDELVFGSNMEYAAIHQFGGTSDMKPQLAAIPARPFLGLSNQDEQEVIEILKAFLL